MRYIILEKGVLDLKMSNLDEGDHKSTIIQVRDLNIKAKHLEEGALEANNLQERVASTLGQAT